MIETLLSGENLAKVIFAVGLTWGAVQVQISGLEAKVARLDTQGTSAMMVDREKHNEAYTKILERLSRIDTKLEHIEETIKGR